MWNGLEEHYKLATGPKTSTTRYNTFSLVVRANRTRVNGDPTVFDPQRHKSTLAMNVESPTYIR